MLSGSVKVRFPPRALVIKGIEKPCIVKFSVANLVLYYNISIYVTDVALPLKTSTQITMSQDNNWGVR